MMHDTIESQTKDKNQMATWLAQSPDTVTITEFKPSPLINKIDLKFDIAQIRSALDEVLKSVEFSGGDGFFALPLNRRPGESRSTANDLSGRYYIRADDRYVEEAREEVVDEGAFSELVPAFKGTYFETIFNTLTVRYPIGRMRILKKPSYNCNSWHRDPEPRLHIPIHTNPGALFIVNNHCTHMPADGSVYFTDTRGYHTALNGGEHPRIHLVAALAY